MYKGHATGGAKATFGILARHNIQYWICHDDLTRQQAFDACHAELKLKQPGTVKQLTDIIKTHVDGIREDHHAKELLKCLVDLEDWEDPDDDDIEKKVVKDNIKLRIRVLDYLKNKGGPTVTFSQKTCPDPLLVFQAWIMPDGDACNSTKEKFKKFLEIVPKRDEDYLLWIVKDDEAKKSKVDLAQRKEITKKRKAESDAMRARKTQQKLAEKETKKKKQENANMKIRAMLLGGSSKALHLKELAEQNCVARAYLKFKPPDKKRDHPPMIKQPEKELKLPEGHLLLNEDGTYQFDPPGSRWKDRMLEIVRATMILVDYMAIVANIPIETFEELEGTFFCRSKVSLAMWILTMDGYSSPCLEAQFDSDLFDAYVEESNSCWMPDLWVEHSKKVFAYFYYYVIGAASAGMTPAEHDTLLTSLLDNMDECLSPEKAKLMRRLVQELFWADAFCSGRYHSFDEAVEMELPCGL